MQQGCTSDHIKAEVELPSNIRRYGFDMDDLAYCHHCKQLKRSVVHAYCNYTSETCGELGQAYYPPAVHIGKVKTYNLLTEPANDRVILKKLVPDRKKRRALE